ncbi:pkb-activating kinase-like protein [Actinomortierella wolfii]|nr:pkb-activating kinase-like protein [Actinomortierella wolfii]
MADQPSSSSPSTQPVEAPADTNQHAHITTSPPGQQTVNDSAAPPSEASNQMASNIHAGNDTNNDASPGQGVLAEAPPPAPVPAGPQPAVRKRSLNDYRLGRTLGEGSYSTVVAAVDLSNNREYAIKVLDKRHIIREKKVKYVNIEKDVLYKLDHPGVVKLYSTFQDSSSLYYVLELGSFDVNCTQFYAAQILSAVEYVHSQGVIHRDLKPENILMDSRMYIKLTDFGTAKILESSEDGTESDRANSFVGTAEYVSPELLTEKSACKSSDWWALGCIIYQLLAGRPPFKGSNEYQTFQKIVKLEYSFPPGFPRTAMDIVSKLLVLDPNQRLGGNGRVEELKMHEFYHGVDWSRLWKDPAPKLLPYLPPTPTHNHEPLRSDHDPANDLWSHLDRIVERKLDEMIQNGDIDPYEGHEEQPIQRRVVNADVHYSDDDDDGPEPDDGIAYADPQDEYMRQLALNGQHYQQHYQHQSYHHTSYHPPAAHDEYQQHAHHSPQPSTHSEPTLPKTNPDQTVPTSPSLPVADSARVEDELGPLNPSPKPGNKKPRNVFAALFSSSSSSSSSQDKQGNSKSSKRQSRQSFSKYRASRDLSDKSLANAALSMTPLSGSTFEGVIQPVPEAMSRENSSMSLGVTAQEVSSQTRKARLELQVKFSPWSKFLLPDELVLYQSPILKRKAFFSKSCFLVLTDYPRLLYFDDSNQNFRRQFYSNTIIGFSYAQQLQIRNQLLLQIQSQSPHQPSLARLGATLEEGEELTPPRPIGNGGSFQHAPSSNTSLSSLHLQPPAMPAATTPASSCSSSSVSLAPASSATSKGQASNNHHTHLQQPQQQRLSISGSPAMTPLAESPVDKSAPMVPMRPAQRPRPPPPKPPLKGEVQLQSRTIVELKGKKCFFIHTSKKSLYFEEVPLPSSVIRSGSAATLLPSSSPATPLPTLATSGSNSNNATVAVDSPSTSTLGTQSGTQQGGASSGTSTPNPTGLQPVNIGDAKTWVQILERTIFELVEEQSS